MRIAYFDCFSGISGDMTIAAFLDAGLDFKLLSRELKRLGIKGYELRRSKVKRCELLSTKFDCVVKKVPQRHKPLKDIINLINKSSLNQRVKETVRDIFSTLGRAEAKVHG